MSVMSSVSPGFILLAFILLSPGSQKLCRCIILFRPCLSLVNFSTDDAGNFVLCEFRFHGKLFRVVSLSAPNRNPARDQFLELVPSWVDPAVPTVVCGDFNTVFDRSLDRTGSVASDTSRESSSTLSWLFDECCVVDAWRYPHPSSSGYTWMSPDGSVSSRIHLVGCPYVWVPSVSSCELFRVRSLTIVPFFCVSLSWMSFPWVLGCGS